MAGIITLLTDFGTSGSYVAQMKGVILSINHDAALIDISHEIPPQDIISGAFVLSQVVPFFPKGSIHVAVVDPGVGGKRKLLLIETDRYFFVGPDNGIFSFALQKQRLKRIIRITNEKYFLDHASSTFHGRDMLSPVAAYLSLGVSPSLFGKKIKTAARLNFEKPFVKNGKITGRIIHVDRFGNLITNINAALLKRTFKNKSFDIIIGGNAIKKLVPSYVYAKKDETVGIIGSSGFLEVAVRDGNAKEKLGIDRGGNIEVRLS